MKYLVIAPQPFFSPRGTPFSVYYRTLISAELGADIDFLTYGQGEDVDIPGVRFFRTPALAFLGPVKIGPSLKKLVHDFFIFFRMLGLLVRNRYDVVHAHEEAVFMALLLKPFFRYKLLYDMHSSLPQQLSNFNFSTNKALLAIFEWLENRSLARSDAIITICPDLYHYVNKILPGNSRNFLIENSILEPVRLKNSQGCADSAEEAPDVPAQFPHRIVYAGTLEAYQGIDILINAMALVVRERKDVLLVIVGGTEEQVQRYRSQAEKLGIADQVLFTGRVAQQLARAWSRQATVLVSPRSSGTNTPLKIYEQLAGGIPLVATAIYSHTQVLTEEVAFLVEPKVQDMAQGLLAALGESALAAEKAGRAQELYNREYARPIYVQKLKRVLESLV
ncbi:MAG: glycosyltransferase family 4 protein [bacterium]|nr:glycosyltransferase family 4 protein [bacterium]